MVISFEMAFDNALDERLLVRAFDLLDAEPVTGCRLVIDPSRPHWQPVPHARAPRLVVTSCEDDASRCGAASLDAMENVQAHACLWRREDGDRLLLRMTHEVGDGAAIRA